MKKTILPFLFLSLGITLCSCEKEDEGDKIDETTGFSKKLSYDLALHFSFDNESITDLSSNGFGGIATPGVEYVSDTPNNKGKAISIDGTMKQYVNVPYDISGDSVNYTVSLWIKDFGTGVIFANCEASTGTGGYTVGSPSLYVNSNGTLTIYHGFAYSPEKKTMNYDVSPYQSSGWHMLTLTGHRKQGMVSLYFDGNLCDVMECYYIRFSGRKFQIGGNGDGHIRDWTDPMLIDNFRVYRRCLSASEIQELYKQEKQ